MNSIIKYLYFSLAILLMTGCNKEPDMFKMEAPEDRMKIAASSSDIVLEEAKEAEDAVTFTWNKATDRGLGTSIQYVFRMYMVENKNNQTDLYEIPADEYSISFTHRELNEILKKWGASAGNNTTVEAEVIANVVSDKQYYKPELSKTTIDVTGYIRNLEQIYLVIVPDDGSEKQYVRMGESVRGSGIYRTDIDDLTDCSYFFSENTDADYPGYMLGDNGEYSLKFVSEEGDYDMLRYTEEGEHVMIVDLGMMDVRIIKPIHELPQNGIWIVGDACDVGYTQDFDIVKTKGAFKNDDPRYPERWTYQGNFYSTVGESSFKLCLEPDKGYGGQYFYAPENNTDPSVKHEIDGPRQGGADNKWKVTSDGVKILTVDLSEMTIDMQPVEDENSEGESEGQNE